MTESSVCPLCGGSGATVDPKDDLIVVECPCLTRKRMRAHLCNPTMALDIGSELCDLSLPSSSPLFKHGQYDLTDQNLFLKGPWFDVRRHLKWVICVKGMQFRYRIVSDERLLNVWLSKEAYTSKPKEVQGDSLSFNTMTDLMDASFDLIVIRLGILCGANRAMPSVLRQALMQRVEKQKPVWVVDCGTQWAHTFEEIVRDEFNRPKRHLAYSAENEALLNQFKEVDLTSGRFQLVAEVFSPDEDGTLGMGNPTEQPERVPNSSYTPRTEPDRTESGKSYWGGHKPKKGGGPLG